MTKTFSVSKMFFSFLELNTRNLTYPELKFDKKIIIIRRKFK